MRLFPDPFPSFEGGGQATSDNISLPLSDPTLKYIKKTIFEGSQAYIYTLPMHAHGRTSPIRVAREHIDAIERARDMICARVRA